MNYLNIFKKNTLVDEFYKLSYKDLKRSGYASIPYEYKKDITESLSKKIKSLDYISLSANRTLLINPKVFRKKRYRVSIRMLDTFKSIDPTGYLTILIDDVNYILLIVNFLKNYTCKISIDDAIEIPIDILNKMCYGELTEEDKLLILITYPNIIFPEVNNGKEEI